MATGAAIATTGARPERDADRTGGGGGGRRDWFASPFIVQTSILAATSLLLFVVIELRATTPFINLRLLGRYNFGLASFMQFTFWRGGVWRGVPCAELFCRVARLQCPRNRTRHDSYGLVQFAMSFMTPPLMKRVGDAMDHRARLRSGQHWLLAEYSSRSRCRAQRDHSSLIVRGIGQSLVVVALSVMSGPRDRTKRNRSASGTVLDGSQCRRCDRDRDREPDRGRA